MTPDEFELIRRDGEVIRAEADRFSTRFYDALFEIAPSTRDLFSDDLVVQRGKLVDELDFLVATAVASRTAHDLGPFLERARELGRRHVGYGVSGADYEPVGDALVAALRSVIEDWDEAHQNAWNGLFRLISDVMREGASNDLVSND